MATFELAAGEDVTCTYTNTQRGSILVEKVTNGGDGTFDFTGDLGDFSLTTASGLAQQTFSDLVPGTYDISETVPAGWTLDAAVCTGGQPASAVVLAPGASIKCDFVNTKIPTGSITVEKQTLPDGDPTTFDFSGDVAGTIGDGGTITVPDLLPGTYSATEALPAGWDLTDISCDDDDSSGDIGTGVATFELAAGEDVTCTYTNTQRGSILVEKVTNGGDGTFDFTGDLGDFSLTTASGLAQQTFSDLVPGTYDISETVPAGWELTDISCDDDDSTGDTGAATALIELAPGEDVTCTFTNTQLATIVVTKATDPAGGAGFEFTGDAAGTIDDGGSITVDGLAAGQYTSTEIGPAGWYLGDITCDDDDSTGDIGTATATFNVTDGEIVECTFTNWELSVIVVEKVTDPAGDATSFDFTTDAGPAFSLADGESQALTSLESGLYSVEESTPPNWTLASATCDNGDTPDAIDLGTGEVVTCTFTNVADPGSITIEKLTDPNPDPTGTVFAFSGDVSGSIGNGQQIVETDLPPGTYTTTELVPSGWTLSSIVCDDDDSTGDTSGATATIVVAAGEDVTCTFTNVAGDVEMVVGKSADKSTVSEDGEDVVFTFTVGNTGAVAFAIESLDDDVYGALDGDADCQVGTVVQPGETCEFEETFLVQPTGTFDPGDEIPDHVNTFESCSILSSGSVQPGAIGTAAVESCDSDSVTIGFKQVEAVPVEPGASLRPTDMLPETDGTGSNGGGTFQLLAWGLLLLIVAGAIVSAGFVVRDGRRGA